MKLWGERNGISRGGGGRNNSDDNDDDNNNNGENDNDGNIGYNIKGRDGGVVGSRGGGNCNGNVESADLGMRRGGKGSVLILVSSDNSPLSSSLLSLSSSASMRASSFPKNDEAGEGGWGVVGGGGKLVLVGGERRRRAAPSPTGYAPVRDDVDGGDANTNKDGGGALKGGWF